jgi:ABC-type multidrug transport system ATPase subunit
MNQEAFMLTVSGLTKRYGKNVACNNINFHLSPGGITVLLGPNGAGKSTLLKYIAGFLRYQGNILVNGMENKSVEAKKIFGYVPEIPALYPNLTVAEHMEFMARAYRLTDYRAYAEELLDRFELTDKKKKFGDELSKGMQQKLALCLGLLPRPQLLLMDEPMIGLDPHAIKELKQMMAEMREEGKTVLVSTHMIDSIDMLWDRTLIMQGGVLRADVARAYLEESGQCLEDVFFAITEGDTPSSAGSEAP